MNVARVDDTDVVVNIEVASAEWLERPETKAAGDRFVEYDDANPAGIGWTYDDSSGTFTPPLTATPHTEGTDDE